MIMPTEEQVKRYYKESNIDEGKLDALIEKLENTLVDAHLSVAGCFHAVASALAMVYEQAFTEEDARAVCAILSEDWISRMGAVPKGYNPDQRMMN